jgi:ABC-2 type transport system ATP-binding protein
MDDIETKGLTKKFNGFTAVDGLTFDIKKGELFGLLGPNGAGKSTTIYMLTTLLKPTSGTAIVGGYDVNEEPDKVRERIGIVFQDQTLDTYLTAFDNLDIHGRLYGMKKEERIKRIDEVLELVELSEWKNKSVKTFSGGMRRRLEIARGLMHTPSILFLDEPTLGLDPQTRRHIWSYIEKLRKEDITILLTTHYLEEADHLCDRVAIIDHGKIKVLDTPENLKKQIGGYVVKISANNIERFADALRKEKFEITVDGDTLSLKTKDIWSAIKTSSEIAKKSKTTITNIETHAPSLEDVFIHYTGMDIRKEKAEGSEMQKRMKRRFGG